MTSLVYMVAGLSSRFEGKPKAFSKITEKETLIEYSLNQALKNPFEEIIFIVSNQTKKLFENKFNHSYKGIKIQYAIQTYNPKKRNKPWGTLDAICSAIDLIKKPVILCNGDDIYGEDAFKILFNHLEKNKDDATLGYKLKNVLIENSSCNRGIFNYTKDYDIKNISEIFDITHDNLLEKNLTIDSLCSMNIFALHPESIIKLNKKLIEFKEKNKDDKNIECLLPVEIGNLISKNEISMKLYPCSDNWYGITNPGDEIVIRNKIEFRNKLELSKQSL
ncbi:MAG: sugar phosphate nucleotidyltransferase [Nanoarchaeota archaeon]